MSRNIRNPPPLADYESSSDSDDSLLLVPSTFGSSSLFTSKSSSGSSSHKKTNHNTNTACPKGEDPMTTNKENDIPPKNRIRSTSSSSTSKHAGRSSMKWDEQEKKRKEKEQCKASNEAKKQKEKLDKQVQKEMEKKQKELQKLSCSQARKRLREESQQVTGKFAASEIVILIDTKLYQQNNQYKLIESLLEANENYTIQDYPSSFLGTATTNGGGRCKYYGNAIQWIRKDYLLGGAKDALQQLRNKHTTTDSPPYEHINRLVIVFDDPKQFIELLYRSDEDDDYPKLANWLQGVQTGWKAAWKYYNHNDTCSTTTDGNDTMMKQPKILLLLYQVVDELDKQWVQYRKLNKKDIQNRPQPPTSDELHDALTWILLHYQVENYLCDTIEDIQNNIVSITRALSELPYQQQVTEIECIKKLKCIANNETDTPLERATECWLRQLQQIPLLSDTMARSLIQYYPTAQSLWLQYQDINKTEEDKRLLLSTCFGGSKAHVKMSDNLYRIMTSTDPKELL